MRRRNVARPVIGTMRILLAARSHYQVVMENIGLIAALVGWFALQKWILPRLGVPT